MDKKQYDLVIKLTENSTSANDLFFRISALLASGKGEQALECLKANRKVLESKLSILMKIHFELLCILGKFDEAYDELAYYENLPYQSQEVEEMLHNLPKYIRTEEKKSANMNMLDDEQVIKLLLSDNVEDVVPALDIVRDRDINVYLPTLRRLMINNPKQSIRTFCLLILVNKKYDQEVQFNSRGNVVTLNPSKLEPPFVGSEFNLFTRKMEIEIKNSSLLETALTLHASYCMECYPNLPECYSDKVMVAIIQIAHEYMKMTPEITLEERCRVRNLDINEVEELIKDINNCLDDF